MPVIVAAQAFSVSGQAAGTYGPFTVGGTLPATFTLTAIGGTASVVQIVRFPGGQPVLSAPLNSPGTTQVQLLPGKYSMTLSGTAVPTNVALFLDGHGGALEYPSQSAAQAHAAELNAALQAGDTDQHIVKQGSISGDLWLVNRASKLLRVNPFLPVSTRTCQE